MASSWYRVTNWFGRFHILFKFLRDLWFLGGRNPHTHQTKNQMYWWLTYLNKIYLYLSKKKKMIRQFKKPWDYVISFKLAIYFFMSLSHSLPNFSARCKIDLWSTIGTKWFLTRTANRTTIRFNEKFKRKNIFKKSSKRTRHQNNQEAISVSCSEGKYT